MATENALEGFRDLDIGKYSEKIIDTMAEALVLIAPDGTILMVNKSFEKMLGYETDEIIGQSCQLLHCDLCEMGRKNKTFSKWCSLFSYGLDVKKRCHVRRKNGTYLPVLKNASLLRDENGEDIGAVEILTDISELDRLDQTIGILSRQLNEEPSFHGIIGKSPAIQKVFELIEKASWSEAPIIIFGDSGTGKELVAQAIHKLKEDKSNL